jgi:zinc transporter ZupT
MILGVGILLVGIIGFFTLASSGPGTTRETRRAPIVLLGLAGLGAFVLFAGIRALLGQWGQMEILEEPRKKL